jgi:hypothetical protein
MWTIGFKIETSYVLKPGEWMQGGEMYILISSSAAAWLLAMLGLCLSWRSRPKGPRHSLLLLWVCVSLACLVIMSGLTPWFRTAVPLVSKVQFPWRLLLIVEFAALTALCLEYWQIRSRSRALLFWLAIIVASPGLVVLVKLCPAAFAACLPRARCRSSHHCWTTTSFVDAGRLNCRRSVFELDWLQAEVAPAVSEQASLL